MIATRLNVALLGAVILTTSCSRVDTPVQAATVAPKQDPWALPAPPPKSVYNGPLFTLSHAYPAKPVPPPTPAPWRKAIGNGKITVANSPAYVKALKDYIAADMRKLLYDYPNWNPGSAGWYNQPWLSKIREPIHGTYVGSTFPKEMFPVSGLKGDMTTHVLVYYDKVSAASMQRLWGASGMNPLPGLNAGGAQFPEGSVIVKPAFTTADSTLWAPMQGAYPWKIYAAPGDGSGSKPPVMQTVNLFQFDIIVKDTASSPKSQWVFATLVYDKSAPGDNWDRMIPLGVMWGNDPDVLSPQGCNYLKPGGCPPLQETWINAAAPVYAKETLGWGGRLSGPNDGAVDINAAVQTSTGGSQPYAGRYAMSSCMSCHGPAEYKMNSFLLPSPATCTSDRCAPTVDSTGRLVYYATGSDGFRRWFQDRPGNVPQDQGSIAFDYDMNYAFKVMPVWFDATGQPGKLSFVEEFRNYRGHRK